MPKVSVIIRTYNRPELLRSSIISVLNQTFQDFEIIVVDDASKDNTQKIVDCFDDSRIKYLRHDINKGASAARNTGIRASNADYIAFLDDDDEWLPEKLELQVDLLEKSSSMIGAVYTGFLMIAEDDRKVLYKRIPSQRGNIYNELHTGNIIGATSPLLRRECFDRVGLFDENLPFAEDWDMWIRISKVFHFEYIEEPLYIQMVRCCFHDKNGLSVNPEAISKGIEIILKKYGKSRAIRKYCSRYYIYCGVIY